MQIACQRELDYTISLLQHMRVQARLVHPSDTLSGLDGGLRKLLGMEAYYDDTYRIANRWSSPRTVYKILDQFMCRYIYFQLPAAREPAAVVIGPYLTADLTRETVLELAEQLNLPLHLLPQMEEHYASLPVYHDPAPLMAIVSTLGETLWGGAAFDMVDVNYEQRVGLPATVSASAPIEQENILERMQQLEERYAYENELMEIVSKGLTNRAEVIMSSVSQLNYQQRLPDPLRNMKNYCIICNTLLRKAAQNGGVHPLYLDRMSGHFARTIETSATPEACSTLVGEMIRAYCRLVRTHARNHHSAIVQKALTYIDANLSGDLSLKTLSGLMKVTPSYLSTLFHRETGRKLAEHITDARMKAALHLLMSSRLQVQTIAQLCGFADPNYFARQFKRFHGMTPLEYRKGATQPAQ